jgi:hypothetical protein
MKSPTNTNPSSPQKPKPLTKSVFAGFQKYHEALAPVETGAEQKSQKKPHNLPKI